MSGAFEARLSYSTNVHPAETAAELPEMIRREAAMVKKQAFGSAPGWVNLRLSRRQSVELLGNPRLPSNSALPPDLPGAAPGALCEELRAALRESALAVASVNAFPVGNFHAARVKERVYSPPWTDGGRVLASVLAAKVFSQLMPADRSEGAVSVPTGTFKGYSDGDEIRAQCAHFLTEAVVELARLERATGKTVALGLEPEPHTTAETLPELIEYFEKFLLPEARAKLPGRLGINVARAEELARRFLTVNLDLCHQAVEFEDACEDLRALAGAGIVISGLHLAAGVKLPNPHDDQAGWAALCELDEPRWLHQVVGKRKEDGALARFSDLPELWRNADARRAAGRTRTPAVDLKAFAELRCHFHVPLHQESFGVLRSTHDVVGPAARLALAQKLTDNFVVETYTWGKFSAPASGRGIGGLSAGDNRSCSPDELRAGLAAELKWAQEELIVRQPNRVARQ
jgi:hypothetical protein